MSTIEISFSSDKSKDETKPPNPQHTYAKRRINGIEILSCRLSAIKAINPDYYQSILEACDKIPQGTKPDSQPAKFHKAAALLEYLNILLKHTDEVTKRGSLEELASRNICHHDVPPSLVATAQEFEKENASLPVCINSALSPPFPFPISCYPDQTQKPDEVVNNTGSMGPSTFDLLEFQPEGLDY